GLESLVEEVDGIGETVPLRRAEDGRSRRGLAPLLEGQEATREVSAVYRRDVARQERLEVPRVVPVEQVPLVMSQARDALEGTAQSEGELTRAEVAQVVGRQRRQ